MQIFLCVELHLELHPEPHDKYPAHFTLSSLYIQFTAQT